MSSACSKFEGSSSGRWLYIRVWYSVFYMQYKKSVFDDYQTHTSTHKTAYTEALEHTMPYLCIHPSSWRWTLRFETCSKDIKN